MEAGDCFNLSRNPKIRVYYSDVKKSDDSSGGSDHVVQRECVEFAADDVLDPPSGLVAFNYDAAFRSIVDFERNMASRRRRLYEADLADRRKIIAASPSEFEAPFSSLEDCVARLLPFHSYYSPDDTIDNRFSEDTSAKLRRKRCISEAGKFVTTLRQKAIVSGEPDLSAEVSILGKLVATVSAENDRLRREIHQRSIPNQRLQPPRQFPSAAHVMSHNLCGPMQRVQWNQ